MKMGKNERQESILRLIRSKDIGTQEELVSELIHQGLAITQATVSRDIKELGIIKVTNAQGNAKYSVLDRTGDVAPGRLLYVFSQSVISCQSAMHLVVIRTLPGMAQGAASALDSIRLPGVVGSIAGDDTVFVATPSPEEAVALALTIRDMNARLNSEI